MLCLRNVEKLSSYRGDAVGIGCVFAVFFCLTCIIAEILLDDYSTKEVGRTDGRERR